uniref:Uncharacterized protein n=1 Tax=Clastoptera arizonana TaxID=38151 RepID=A0A1B6C662_9HEMI
MNNLVSFNNCPRTGFTLLSKSRSISSYFLYLGIINVYIYTHYHPNTFYKLINTILYATNKWERWAHTNHARRRAKDFRPCPQIKAVRREVNKERIKVVIVSDGERVH